MLYTLPDYYPQFHCIADKCEETCCAGWQIVIDRQSLRKYVHMKGPYRRRLLFSINYLNSTFLQDEDKNCAHLNKDGLCELYRNAGPESLCRTCRLFPRHIEEFENVREISLELSCPEVCRMVLEKQEKVTYRTFERHSGKSEENFEDYDDLFYSQLDYARWAMIDLAQNRAYTVPQRCAVFLAAAEKLQKCYDHRQLFSFGDVLAQISESGSIRNILKKASGLGREEYLWEQKLFRTFRRMEPLRASWTLWLEEVTDRLYRSRNNQCRKEQRYPGEPAESIENVQRQAGAHLIHDFERWMKRNTTDWEIPFEQILVYFIFSDFCGSVYDGDIRTTAMTIASYVLAVRRMMAAVWYRNEGTMNLEDLENMTVRCCREIGHSDHNRRILAEFLKKEPLPLCRVIRGED